MRPSFVLAILTLTGALGCGSAPAAPTAPAPSPNASAASAGKPAAPALAEAAPAAARKPDGSLPPFARLDVKHDVEYPDRVRLQHAGRLAVEWPEEDAEPVEEKKVDWEPPVIKEGVEGAPFRILCRDAEVQLAAYVKASSLGTIVREPVLLHPKTNPPEKPGEREPGALLARGALVTVLGSISVVDHLRFERAGLSVDGFARRAMLGHMFRPDPLPPDASIKYDAELSRTDAVLLPEPNKAAKPMAKLSPYLDGQGAHRFQRLGDKKNGFSLVRLHHPETSVVGWIEDGALQSGSGSVTFQKEHQAGHGKLRGSKMMLVKRGEVLHGPKSGQPIGVITGDHMTPCMKRCESTEPLIAVRACGGVARAMIVREGAAAK